MVRRLDGGQCLFDENCNARNGECRGSDPSDPANPVFGECKCKDGWDGDFCEDERCGDVTSCGKHGKCRHDECDCDEGYTGDDCDDEIDYEVRLIVFTNIDSKTRGNTGCQEDVKKKIKDLDDEDDDDLLDLSAVTVVDVSTGCGDGETLDNRSIIDRHRRHLDSSGSDDDDEEPIVIGVVLVKSSTRGASDDDCLEKLKDAADELSDDLKAKRLKELDGKVVYIEADDECDGDNTKRILENGEQDEDEDEDEDEDDEDEDEDDEDEDDEDEDRHDHDEDEDEDDEDI